MTPTAVRFWRKVLIGEPSDCWLWAGSRKPPRGYGQLYVRGSKQPHKAHRFSYEFFNGPIPSGMVVMHACDNPPCVNPHHLRVGTQLENIADSKAKNRTIHGPKNHNIKLTAQQAQAVYLLRGRCTTREAGKQFGVSSGTVWSLWRGLTHQRAVSSIPEAANQLATKALSEIESQRFLNEQAIVDNVDMYRPCGK